MMVMCSRCHKRMAVVFMTKYENGKETTEGICIKCAKELGIPIDNMIGNISEKFGISPEGLENMEDSLEDILGFDNGVPSDNDDKEDGGAPAIDFPKLFKESGILKNSQDKANTSKSASKNDKGKEKKKKFLDTYCRNLTLKASEGKLDKIIGREKELARVTQILCRRQKNNPCLIGEPGVGKTAIAEALSQKIADGDVPYKLKNKEIYLVDLTALVAGTQFRGQFESRILGLLNEVREAGNIILVIDEVHNIVGAGGAEGSINAANILKPALSRGEVQVIGATTLNEYRKHIEKDSALERRFQPVMVNEPSVEDSVEMLRGIKHYYEEFHSIKIPDELLRKAVEMSERYITDRYLPDKAIDLLDEAASHLSLNSAPLNESSALREKLLDLKAEREALENASSDENADASKKYEEIANIKALEIKASEQLKTLEQLCQDIILTTENIAEVVEIWTGIPASSITEDEFEKIDKLEQRLKTRIVGQDHAVSAVAMAIKRNRAGISYKRKPVSFIFAGPTGVGKTELVKVLSNELFDSPENLIRLDMSEFMEKHSVSRIIGAPPGYVGYDEAGQLTEKIRRKPYSVILFDEIEKAHPDVLNILLQILDDGRISDAHGKIVNFENTIIVMTTNAGSDRTASKAGFLSEGQSLSEERTQKALEGFLRPEFINRVDAIITFNSLNTTDFSKIAQLMLNELAEALKSKNIKLSYSSNAAEHIAANSFSQKFGARNMRRYIQTNVEDRLAELIISDYKHSITQAMISVKGGKLNISCM